MVVMLFMSHLCEVRELKQTNKKAHTAKFDDFLFNRKHKTSLGFRCLQQTISIIMERKKKGI
jgi:hypothetical protein